MILEPRKGRVKKSRKVSFSLSIISIAKKARLATKEEGRKCQGLKGRLNNLFGTSHFPLMGFKTKCGIKLLTLNGVFKGWNINRGEGKREKDS